MAQQNQSWISKLNQWLIPALATWCVGFGVYVVKTNKEYGERIIVVEKWQQATDRALMDEKKTHDDGVARSHEALRVAIMRDVENEASRQRAAIQEQLSSIQKDVLRIAIMLDIQRPKEPAAWKPSNGDAKKDGDTIDRILNR